MSFERQIFERQILARPAAISAFTEEVMRYLAGAGVDNRTAHHVALAGLGNSHDEQADRLEQDRAGLRHGFLEPDRARHPEAHHD